MGYRVVVFAAALLCACVRGAVPTNEKVVFEIPECVRATDGADVHVIRCIGGPQGGTRASLDPFLVFDVYRATEARDFERGFPAHPHRGFLEMRYLHAGSLLHEDSCGVRGGVQAGGLQLLNAGRGIVHEEKVGAQSASEPAPGPGVNRAWLFAGFQVWLQLPAERQADPPGYRAWPTDDLFPRYTRPGRKVAGAPPTYRPPAGAVVKVIAGEFGGAVGPVTANTSATGLLWLDVEALRVGEPPLRIDEPVDDRHAVIYVYRGAVAVGSPAVRQDVVEAGEFALLYRGIYTELSAVAQPSEVDPSSSDPAAASFLYLSADRVGEPAFVTQGFAAATKAGLDRAVDDLQEGHSTHC